MIQRSWAQKPLPTSVYVEAALEFCGANLTILPTVIKFIPSGYPLKLSF